MLNAEMITERITKATTIFDFLIVFRFFLLYVSYMSVSSCDINLTQTARPNKFVPSTGCFQAYQIAACRRENRLEQRNG